MKKNYYEHICSEAKAGHDVFVSHLNSKKQGFVMSCVLPSNQLIVKTAEGEEQCWDASECEEVIDLNSRPMV